MIEEIEKKLTAEKARHLRLENSLGKCAEKIRDYEATLRVLSEINKSSSPDDGKDRKKTVADYIVQALKSIGKPSTRADLMAFIRLTEGVEINENTVVGTLQRLRTSEAVDCSKDNLWSLRTPQQATEEKTTPEDEDEIPF